jgi:hypothetical protein
MAFAVLTGFFKKETYKTSYYIGKGKDILSIFA